MMSSHAAENAPPATARKNHSLFFRALIRYEVAKCFADPIRGADLVERFAASTTGELPTAGKEGILLAACDDRYYRRFAVTLLLSLERLGVRQAVHLHLLQPSAPTLDHIARLRASLSHVRLSWTTDPCLMAATMDHPSIYFTSARFLIAHTLLSRLRAPILCIDVDGVVVRPVWESYRDHLQRGDIGLILRPSKRKPWQKVHAAAVGQNPNPAGLAFSSAIARSLARLFRWNPAYHLDQIALWYGVLEGSKRMPNLHIFEIPQRFADHEFRADAVIWTPKGWITKQEHGYQQIKQEIDQLFPDLSLSSDPSALT